MAMNLRTACYARIRRRRDESQAPNNHQGDASIPQPLDDAESTDVQEKQREFRRV